MFKKLFKLKTIIKNRNYLDTNWHLFSFLFFIHLIEQKEIKHLQKILISSKFFDYQIISSSATTIKSPIAITALKGIRI